MRFFHAILKVFVLFLLFGTVALPQETTGGIQGTVKDPTGAVVPNAKVVVTGSSLVGSKEAQTDSAGYYRFANLPPGTYAIAVSVQGFKTIKREGQLLEVGHLPTVDFALEMGSASSVVEVTSTAPLIDTTTTHNMTNVTSDTLANVPVGYTFQSVIQFAPMARNEPLSGGMGGNGGAIPGSTANGYSVGFMIGGAADSESSYLVEGQDTEDISGGASRAQVPFQFIDEVQVKTSGLEAEHGGALGGVINVVMRKGSNAIHGSLFSSYEADPFDGSANGTLRYDPFPTVNAQGESDSQTYYPKKDHFRTVQPGFIVGGPVVKDRLFFFLGFAPLYNSRGRTVDFTASTYPGNSALGKQLFTQDDQQYFTTARLDSALTKKIRVFGSWLYQYQRESGSNLPAADSVARQSYFNPAIESPIQAYSHGIGFAQPNSTYNVGADMSLTPKIVATTRFGYFFNNYHDFGWPTTGVNLSFSAGGAVSAPGCSPNGTTCVADNAGKLYPAPLQLPTGSNSNAYDGSFTQVNASKHYQFNEDVAFFKGGWWGTHNIKVGYQLNHLSNVIDQHPNIPNVNVVASPGIGYSPSTANGAGQCGNAGSAGPPPVPPSGLIGLNPWGICAGEYGYATSSDFATILKRPDGTVVPASDYNHALFAQDSWTVGKGLTLTLGLRVEKESLPAPSGIGIAGIRTIDFSWSDKISPRLGAAWGTANGKLKIFGSYGVVNDVMKLLLAQSSFGAQLWNQCTYPLGPNSGGGFNYTDITLQLIPNVERACPTAVANVGANFAGGVVPQVFTDKNSGVQLIENINLRPEEPIVPGLKPYRQHEYVAGVDYQVAKDWAFEARYDRRRLDHVIEDSSLADPNAFEIYNIVNPGQGVNRTIDGYAAFLTSLGNAYGPGTAAFNPTGAFGTCPTCPPMPLAVRNYDGVELRLTKSTSHGWAGMFSYTWSSLWGNYTGLTTTDQTDGGITGRNSPDTTRSFDEPFYYYTYRGTSANGPLPTDRPNAFKGDVYYTLPWKRMKSTIGLFQVAYQGSPVSSFVDLGLLCCGFTALEATPIWGRGNWVNASADPTTGITTLGNAYARRTPWYTQTDLNVAHSFKVNKNNEHQELTFQGTFINVLNQHAIVAYWGGLASSFSPSALFQGQIFSGASFYKTVETGYNPQAVINAQATSAPLLLNSHYASPNLWQLSRSIRLGVRFTF